MGLGSLSPPNEKLFPQNKVQPMLQYGGGVWEVGRGEREGLGLSPPKHKILAAYRYVPGSAAMYCFINRENCVR